MHEVSDAQPSVLLQGFEETGIKMIEDASQTRLRCKRSLQRVNHCSKVKFIDELRANKCSLKIEMPS